MHQTSVDQGIRGLKQSEKLEFTLDESGSGPDYEHLLHRVHWAVGIALTCLHFWSSFFEKNKKSDDTKCIHFSQFPAKNSKKKFAKNIHFCYSRFSSEMCVIFV